MLSYLLVAFSVSVGSSSCPGNTTQVDSFTVQSESWRVCEDLQQPAGAIVLVPETEKEEWFPKSYSLYGSANDSSTDFYLGLGKKEVMSSKADILGIKMLSKNYSGITWDLVANAVPPIRDAGGVRAFVGSRSSVADTTFNDEGEDAAGYGFPPAKSYVFNLTNMAEGGAPFKDVRQYINQSGMAEGLVGGELPVVIFYYPVLPTSKYLPSGIPSGSSRYWNMIAAPFPDMKGSREQGVYFRFQQIECAGLEMAPPCKMIGKPQYWDTYWWSNSPGNNGKTVSDYGPTQAANAAGFYQTLRSNRVWWDRELAKEGMMELSLPSSSKTTTNGTFLKIESTHNLILSMITKHDTWGPRYGVLPGYGITMQNGFEDVFTSTAMAAVEWGAMPYAKGLIENQFSHYIRDDGLTNYRANEVAQQARMLTILALYHSYSGDDAFVLKHFPRAKALADWLTARRATSLREFSSDDPRHGLIAGLDEGDSFVHVYFHQGPFPVQHWYSHLAEAYRAFVEIGQMWTKVGAASKRDDVRAHGAELLKAAPSMYHDLHASLNKTANTTASPGHTCFPDNAGVFGGEPTYGGGCAFRSYPELFYSGALTAEQTDAMYTSGQGATNCPVGRWLSNGSPSSGDGLIFTHIPQGLPFGLLVHDMVERFLLFFFHQSAHANTRGTFTTPESTRLDRNGGAYAYASAGQGNVPLCMKWMLAFEEPETQTLWLAKATPRDWLAVGENPLAVANLTTQYGRMSFSLTPPPRVSRSVEGTQATAGYSVEANVTLPASFASNPPPGGIKVRVRAPVQHAGKMTGVTVGGAKWAAFNAAEETIEVAAGKIDAKLIATGLPAIVVTFA